MAITYNEHTILLNWPLPPLPVKGTRRPVPRKQDVAITSGVAGIDTLSGSGWDYDSDEAAGWNTVSVPLVIGPEWTRVTGISIALSLAGVRQAEVDEVDFCGWMLEGVTGVRLIQAPVTSTGGWRIEVTCKVRVRGTLFGTIPGLAYQVTAAGALHSDKTRPQVLDRSEGLDWKGATQQLSMSPSVALPNPQGTSMALKVPFPTQAPAARRGSAPSHLVVASGTFDFETLTGVGNDDSALQRIVVHREARIPIPFHWTRVSQVSAFAAPAGILQLQSDEADNMSCLVGPVASRIEQQLGSNMSQLVLSFPVGVAGGTSGRVPAIAYHAWITGETESLALELPHRDPDPARRRPTKLVGQTALQLPLMEKGRVQNDLVVIGGIAVFERLPGEGDGESEFSMASLHHIEIELGSAEAFNGDLTFANVNDVAVTMQPAGFFHDEPDVAENVGWSVSDCWWHFDFKNGKLLLRANVTVSGGDTGFLENVSYQVVVHGRLKNRGQSFWPRK